MSGSPPTASGATMISRTAAEIAQPAMGALGHALVAHASTVTSGKTSMPTSNQVTMTDQDHTSYEDIITDLKDHHEITVRIYILNDDKWDADNEFPGHNTPGDKRIVFKDADKQMRTEYTTNGGAEVRILVLDEEEEIIGAMSGGLNKQGQIRKTTTYGTIWVREEYRAFQKADIGWGMPLPYSISMALHEIMDLLAVDRGATTLVTEPLTPAGKVSAARYGFKPVGPAGKYQLDLANRKTWTASREEYREVMFKRGNKGPKPKES